MHGTQHVKRMDGRRCAAAAGIADRSAQHVDTRGLVGIRIFRIFLNPDFTMQADDRGRLRRVRQEDRREVDSMLSETEPARINIGLGGDVSIPEPAHLICEVLHFEDT